MTLANYTHRLREEQRAHGAQSHKTRKGYRKNAALRGRKARRA